MAGTKIENASDTLLANTPPTGTEYIALGKSGWTTSYKMSLTELSTWIRESVDRIVEGDSKLQIEDSGSGAYLLANFDGTDRMAMSAGSNGLLFSDPASLTNEVLDLTYVASGTNYIQLKAAATGNPIEINALGSDTNIPIKYSTKGNESHDFYVASTKQISIEDGSILPTTDNDIDLGSSTYEFKNLYIDGTGNIDSLVLGTGATVDTIETTLTDDDTHLPTSGAVYDAIHDNSGWQDAGTYVHLHTGTDKVYVGASGTTPTERMEIDGAIKIGTAAGTANGVIRYTGTDVEARIGGAWVSMTSSTGIVVKEAVVAATTANGTLATAFANGQTIDGVTLVTGDRILIKDQSTASENGIYVVTAGAPTRATDMDDASEFYNGYVFVTGGTSNANSGWIETLTVTTVDTNPVAFQQFSASNSYTAGNGLRLVGSEFSAVAHTGIAVSGSGVAIDPTYVCTLGTNQTLNGNKDFQGTVDIAPVHETDPGTMFMVIEATTEQVKYRTAAEVASDISAVTSDKYLSAVNVNAINDVDFVITNGTDITAVDFSHSHGINDLSDVTISSVADGEVVQYYGTGGYWRNRTLAEAGIEPTLTKGDLTETTSNVLTITGGTSAVIGTGVTVQVDLAAVSNGDTTHLCTADAIYDFVTSQGYITGNQTITLSGDVTGSGSTSIVTTIASNAVEASMLNNNVISGQTALTSGLESTDELLVSDAGVIKRMDISVLSDYLDLESYDRWHSWTASRTSNSVITSTTNIEAGTPVRYRATAGTWRYGVIDSRSGNDHTIVGYPCSASDDDEFQYGNPEMVEQIHFHISGAFASGATTASATGGALYDYNKMKHHYKWMGSPGYVVAMNTSCFEEDSSSDPTVDAEISSDNSTFNDIFSAAVDADGTERNSGVTAQSAYYTIERNYYLDFSITAGGTGDAKDLDIYLTIVLA